MSQEEWKPIWTAPRDGTRIEMRNANSGIEMVCKWDADNEGFMTDDPPGELWPLQFFPTHWRPVQKTQTDKRLNDLVVLFLVTVLLVIGVTACLAD
jgi:hypothetical protein